MELEHGTLLFYAFLVKDGCVSHTRSCCIHCFLMIFLLAILSISYPSYILLNYSNMVIH